MSKEYFSHDIGTLNNSKIIKMMDDYGFMGFGYYWAIVEEIYRADGEFDMADISVMSKNTGIDENELTTFINKCIDDYTEKGKGLFVIENNLLSSLSVKKRLDLRKKRSEARAGKSPVEERIDLEGIEFVNLTEEQYNKLCDKYGKDNADRCISILDNWLARKGQTAKQYIGNNHYAFFRSDGWVVGKMKETNKVNWGV
ncbi:TPA: hypothetical protein CPT89_01145 [Candidatus Gastranaerophilales bacterium HUM_11]|nr:MAG TPA: hypothetical protein CPT89_01145 [Candidatus Gastranaerophilales bacterium HUM_11]